MMLTYNKKFVPLVPIQFKVNVQQFTVDATSASLKANFISLLIKCPVSVYN